MVVHPLVLLSVVDHYTRVAKDTARRVVGVLLGEASKGRVDVTNSYALPFEEDPKDGSIWYIDRQYHEDMFAMFRKVNAKEKVIGWYSTGPKIRPPDLEINELFRQYTAEPVYVIIDVNAPSSLVSSLSSAESVELPTSAYVAVPSGADQQTTPTKTTFLHLPSELGALEAEEVGVEHLLRGVKDVGGSTLTDVVQAKLTSLRGLRNRLVDVIKYVDYILSSRVVVNHKIVYQLQDMLNLLPDITVNPAAVQALSVNTNDNTMVTYVASLIRCIIALHDLINNKIVNRQLEIEEHKKHQEEKRKRKEELAAAAATAGKDTEKDSVTKPDKDEKN